MARKKVRFIFSDEAGDITLTEALAGAVGDVHMGPEGVHLWVPSDVGKVDKNREIIFDFRLRPLDNKIGAIFEQGMKGHFMTAKVALLAQFYPDRVEKILEIFDYVLVPDSHIKNTPADFRARVLSYEKKKMG